MARGPDQHCGPSPYAACPATSGPGPGTASGRSRRRRTRPARGGGPKPLPSGPQTDRRSPSGARQGGRAAAEDQVDHVDGVRGPDSRRGHVVEGEGTAEQRVVIPGPGRIIRNCPGRIAPGQLRGRPAGAGTCRGRSRRSPGPARSAGQPTAAAVSRQDSSPLPPSPGRPDPERPSWGSALRGPGALRGGCPGGRHARRHRRSGRASPMILRRRPFVARGSRCRGVGRGSGRRGILARGPGPAAWASAGVRTGAVDAGAASSSGGTDASPRTGRPVAGLPGTPRFGRAEVSTPEAAWAARSGRRAGRRRASREEAAARPPAATDRAVAGRGP